MARARRTSDHGELSIAPAGEGACIARLGASMEPATHQRVLALLSALDAAPPLGLRDLTPTAAAILIQFDPLQTSAATIAAHVRAVLATAAGHAVASGRLVRIPVRYGGADGPDLEPLARGLGMAPGDVVRLHTGAEYRVYFLGFVGGFPYLGGLPAALAASRLPTPRTRVPAGSVGIAGTQTGIYPVASPGGWRLIGRTPVALFDPSADPPTLLRPGDRVRFTAETTALPAPAPKPSPAPATPDGAAPWLRIVRPGPLTTVQDLGRPGYARFGVSPSGAADADALRQGNALLGNPLGAAALEVTLGGMVADALGDCVVALTGADSDTHLNGRALPAGTAWALAAGDRLEVAPARRGARAYLCVAGGVAVVPVLGSAATDVRAGMGVSGRSASPSGPRAALPRTDRAVAHPYDPRPVRRAGW
jgi:antagonist of KipI